MSRSPLPAKSFYADLRRRTIARSPRIGHSINRDSFREIAVLKGLEPSSRSHRHLAQTPFQHARRYRNCRQCQRSASGICEHQRALCDSRYWRRIPAMPAETTSNFGTLLQFFKPHIPASCPASRYSVCFSSDHGVLSMDFSPGREKSASKISSGPPPSSPTTIPRRPRG